MQKNKNIVKAAQTASESAQGVGAKPTAGSQPTQTIKPKEGVSNAKK